MKNGGPICGSFSCFLAAEASKQSRHLADLLLSIKTLLVRISIPSESAAMLVLDRLWSQKAWTVHGLGLAHNSQQLHRQGAARKWKEAASGCPHLSMGIPNCLWIWFNFCVLSRRQNDMDQHVDTLCPAVSQAPPCKTTTPSLFRRAWRSWCCYRALDLRHELPRNLDEAVRVKPKSTAADVELRTAKMWSGLLTTCKPSLFAARGKFQESMFRWSWKAACVQNPLLSFRQMTFKNKQKHVVWAVPKFCSILRCDWF